MDKIVVCVSMGVAAGWRVVQFADGTTERMPATELADKYGVNPFLFSL